MQNLGERDTVKNDDEESEWGPPAPAVVSITEGSYTLQNPTDKRVKEITSNAKHEPTLVKRRPSQCIFNTINTLPLQSPSPEHRNASNSNETDADSSNVSDQSVFGPIEVLENTSGQVLVTNSVEPSANLPEACLFVASLSTSVSDKELNHSLIAHFSQWGQLNNVKVLKDWLARPYAFVQYESVQAAQTALLRAHNTIVNGRYIRVEQAKVNRTLFIGKFGSTSPSELNNVLETFGAVEDLNVLHDFKTGRGKGCGFVKFCHREDAIKAFVEIRQKYQWTVEWATNLDRNKPEIDLKSIFIGQLNQNLITNNLLEERFKKYGEIKSCQVVNKPLDEGPARPAFAFITFVEETSAEQAIENENAKLWLDRTIRVQYREIGEYKGLSRSMKKQLQNAPVKAADKTSSSTQSMSIKAIPMQTAPPSASKYFHHNKPGTLKSSNQTATSVPPYIPPPATSASTASQIQSMYGGNAAPGPIQMSQDFVSQKPMTQQSAYEPTPPFNASSSIGHQQTQMQVMQMIPPLPYYLQSQFQQQHLYRQQHQHPHQRQQINHTTVQTSTVTSTASNVSGHVVPIPNSMPILGGGIPIPSQMSVQTSTQNSSIMLPEYPSIVYYSQDPNVPPIQVPFSPCYMPMSMYHPQQQQYSHQMYMAQVMHQQQQQQYQGQPQLGSNTPIEPNQKQHNFQTQQSPDNNEELHNSEMNRQHQQHQQQLHRRASTGSLQEIWGQQQMLQKSRGGEILSWEQQQRSHVRRRSGVGSDDGMWSTSRRYDESVDESEGVSGDEWEVRSNFF
ncbi:hypothetical protein BDR26DRAFT_636722 [Obelidium mucronatum]|nr:hypothetical protein BDR26DRAFT_636722 [Obelidium mucronatum]